MSYFSHLQKKIKSILGVNQKKIETPTYVAARKKMYAQFFSGAGDLYFDVGANMGNRIEPLIDMGLKIVAVEPQKKLRSSHTLGLLMGTNGSKRFADR